MRPKSACIICRGRRRKCIRSQQGTACDFCCERSLRCILTEEPDTVQDDGYEPTVPRRAIGFTEKLKSLPPTDLCEELINLYFRYIHVSFHVLFHRPSFLSAFNDGSLPKVLLLAVLGLSARFSDHESLAGMPPRERGRPFTKEAERLLNLHSTSLTTIQACLLLGASAVVEGEASTESVYFSIACRIALLLDLPNAPVATRIQQEVNYRVWWACYETDTWSATGVRLSKIMPFRNNVPLPMAEEAFLKVPFTAPPDASRAASCCSPPTSQALAVPEDSLIAQSVTVNLIFSRVDDTNSRAVSGGLRGSDLIWAVEQTCHELDSWEASLPENMVDTPENLAYWTEKGFGNIFVIVHMNYYHLCQLLFYQFLHGSAGQGGERQQPKTVQYAQKCRDYATQVCKLIHLANETPGAELLNSIVGHVLTIASTVQLHILLFSGDEGEVENARRLLERNFKLLTHLEVYWPCIDISFSRFEAFHRACSLSQDDSLFRMDQWMLRFILAFAIPLDERWKQDDDE